MPQRFALRTLFAGMTLLTVLIGVSTLGGVSVLGLALTTVANAIRMTGPICLGLLAIHCRGQRRTFFLGAFAAAAWLAASSPPEATGLSPWLGLIAIILHTAIHLG
ncbi:MAG TPA: hypothetical protein PJ982_16415, partial [Lacipirellulaceae bacterium]|nr:hypothetical protein [Lacipirellulaceae bacterium]